MQQSERIPRSDANFEAASTSTAIDVAVGILMKANGEVLFGQRPAGKPYAGYWEFPGGKVEAGEALLDALKREFVEELGVQIITATPWCGVAYVYPHAHVHLHFYICRAWLGQPQSLEGQAFAWHGQLEPGHNPEPLLPATIPLLEWLDEWRQGSATESETESETEYEAEIETEFVAKSQADLDYPKGKS